ncbi:MAG TPA: hypothetical protein VEY88_19570 [Archangium sp.]|nr:hypothetical protein [Archangium sp.]
MPCPSPAYAELVVGGLCALVSGVLAWKASRRSVAVTFLMFVPSATLAWLLLRECFLAPLAFVHHDRLGRVWCGLAVACALPAPLLSLAGVVRGAVHERPGVPHYVGGVLFLIVYRKLVLNVSSNPLSPIIPEVLLVGFVPLALAIVSWQASQRWIVVTLLLLVVGAMNVWSTATMRCVSDVRGFSYASPPFGCGSLMPLLLFLPVLSLWGLVQWVQRQRLGIPRTRA